MNKPTLQQAMQMARGSWPTAWDVDPTDALRVLAERVDDLQAKLALAAENSMGDAEVTDVLRQIVNAEDDFRKSTGMQSNDALSDAINQARALLKDWT